MWCLLEKPGKALLMSTTTYVFVEKKEKCQYFQLKKKKKKKILSGAMFTNNIRLSSPGHLGIQLRPLVFDFVQFHFNPCHAE